MLHLLQRHPLPIVAHFRECAVLTYAYPADLLRPLLPPGLELDEVRGHGFVAVALVQTASLRPADAPRILGQDFFLAGYRVFATLRTESGARLRGLRILRSYTDRMSMALCGNLLTHYRYRLGRVRLTRDRARLGVEVSTRDGSGDLSVEVNLGVPPALPSCSFFQSEREARRFAGPLPNTFDYEPQTHSIIVIRGVRQNWSPRFVQAQVKRIAILERPPFDRAPAVLSSAFFLEDVPYRWERGVRRPLPSGNGQQV